MEPEGSLPQSQVHITLCFATRYVLRWGGPPLVGCPRLLIQYIRSYPLYAVPPTATWGRAMPWWQVSIYRGSRSYSAATWLCPASRVHISVCQCTTQLLCDMPMNLLVCHSIKIWVATLVLTLQCARTVATIRGRACVTLRPARATHVTQQLSPY